MGGTRITRVAPDFVGAATLGGKRTQQWFFATLTGCQWSELELGCQWSEFELGHQWSGFELGRQWSSFRYHVLGGFVRT